MSDPAEGVREQLLAPGLLRWTLVHPRKRNALSVAMLAWLRGRAEQLRGEVVVLDGDGDHSFCAGFDLDALPVTNVLEDRSVAPDDPLIAATAAIRRADATFIAVLHGPVYGAGVELACSCDVRLARADTHLIIPAARLGVVYHPDGLALLRGCFGAALATRLLLLGDAITADEALRAGCLHGVYAADELAAAVAATADKLRAGAPHSLRAHRDRLRALLTRTDFTPAEDAAYEAARRTAYISADHLEGRTAVRERRPPRFTGA